ncbi:hypothetical protein FB45DRAFT_1059925 [Roridomyces roridus]|uniref:F-box domain-containing protein n=1 Tax=Roridomyces roridus TaxID=1738132 RepID=A0AAD7BPP5_9AGAR|nr:hypothetical protein FB45DRAFT_1059925 [Roridomyces roridus]
MSLPDCPLDIILELAKNLDLTDSLHLAATCTTFAEMRHSPSFWIESLKRMETFHRRPLPCPIGTDLTTLPLDKLRDIAIHAYKLRKDWAAESLNPVRVGKFDMGFHDANFDAQIVWTPSILCIPGTGMIVTISPNHFTCWDASSGAKIGACFYGDASIGWSEWILSRPFHIPGMFYLGIASESDDHFGNRELKLTVHLHDLFPSPICSRLLDAVVVNEDTIGAVTSNFEVGWPGYQIAQLVRTAVTPRSSYPVAIVDISNAETLTLPPVLSNIQLPTCSQVVQFSPAEWDDPVLRVGTPFCYQHSSHLSWMNPGSSLSSALICSHAEDLGLLQYTHEPSPRVDFRALPVSDEIRPAALRMDACALDDRLGALYVVKSGDETPCVHVLSYA